MKIRSVFGEAFRTYFRRWWELVPRAFVIYLFLSLAALAAGQAFGGGAGIAASALITFLGYFWLQALHVLEVAGGEEAARTFRRAARRLLPLMGASILAGVGMVIGLFLLVLPGLVLLAWWSLLVPAVVLEGHGPRAALRRSRELVRGHGVKVFTTMVISVVIVAPIAVVLLVVISYVFKDSPETASFVGDLVVDPVTAPFGVLVWTSVYFRLREAEAAGAELRPRTALVTA
jgi:hypothetical protein